MVSQYPVSEVSLLARRTHYNVWKLVDHREHQEPGSSNKKIRIVSDIDKTYLETAFESWVNLARIPFEDATDKQSVNGAPQLLTALRWGDTDKPLDDGSRHLFPRPLHFVSSSPPQLRNVLDEKMSMDGLDWTSDTFKDQAYNIRKGRFNLLRQQVAYKSAALIRLMSDQDPEAAWYLIGDNAESDAFIYLGIKLLCEGQLSQGGFAKWLGLAEVGPEMISQLWSGPFKPPAGKVRGIFIRNIKGHRFYGTSPLTDPVTLFDSYLDAGLALYQCGVLTPGGLESVIRAFHNLYDTSLEEICGKVASTIAGCRYQDLSFSLQNLLEKIAKAGRIALPVNFSYTVRMASEAHSDILEEEEILRLGHKWMDKIRSGRG